MATAGRSESPGVLRASPVAVERCPLCNQRSRAFYCRECVRHGTFYHSRMRLPERYADKKLRCLRLRREVEGQQQQVEELHGERTRQLLLKERAEEVRGRVELLQLVLREAKENLLKVKRQTAEVSNGNAVLRHQLPIFFQRLSKMKKILAQYREKIQEKQQQVVMSEGQLKGVVRSNIHQLTRYIFPISEVKPPRSADSDPGRSSTVWALAEASQTTYVRGRWVYTDTSHETQFRVVEPLLPGSGDYSAYNLAVLSLGSGADGEEGDGEERGGGFNITAGLTYLAQLVNILAFYLDVTLPKKLCYSEFCRGELTEQQFARRVARLNTNVVYLCLSQKVPPSLLRPAHTVANVLTLLDTKVADLGRQGSFEIPLVLVESLEDVEEEHAEGTDSEEEEDTDTLSAEWETVPNLPMLEPPSIPTHQAYSTFNSTAALYSQATMVGQGTVAGPGGAIGAAAGGLVSSAAASVMSLFRGLSGAPQK